jgi:hypothetical protein
MSSLESDIDCLKDYNNSRITAAKLRNRGLDALKNSIGADDQRNWTPIDGILEHAEVLKALLLKSSRDEADFKRYSDLAKPLEVSIGIRTVMSDEPHPHPVLRAAKAMCALAAAPDSAFSEAMMYYLYCIVREIHVADEPNWSVGSARSGIGAAPSAYVTWQCVRAIKDFQLALRQTASLLEEVALLLQANENFVKIYLDRDVGSSPANNAFLEQWSTADSTRLTLSFTTSIVQLRDNIALRLDSLKGLESKDLHAVTHFIHAIRSELKKRINEHRTAFNKAITEIDNFRNAEFGGPTSGDIRRVRSETAHALGRATVVEAREYTEKALECFNVDDSPVAELSNVAREFRKAEGKFHNLLAPIKANLSNTLDRELAAVLTQGTAFLWDPAETAFAAAAYGEVTGAWSDERLARAVHHLLSVVGERGQIPVGRPIGTRPDGYRLYPPTSEVLRALARVLEHVSTPQLEPRIVERLLNFFRDLEIREDSGIFQDSPSRDPQSRRATALAVLALGSINRMLDVRINETVYSHFSTRRSDELKMSLRNLFYGDYGLRLADPIREEKTVPVAVVMEQMRAHVLGVSRRVLPRRAPYSLVLYGPPGTGKTMLVEGLARSCKVPLVEVTPSDIVIGGAENIERRTRDVMFALSLLTRTIILFDEFDPVLLRRNAEESNPSVFSFLTPGMLPKLKNLYERARERSTAYVLITNLIGKLDEAAVREGRFDVHVGIYPPDLLSRYGRLSAEADKYRVANAEKYKAENEEQLLSGQEYWDRLWTLVVKSAGGSMTTLGRPGWFTAPEEIEPHSAFAYLAGHVPEPPSFPREASRNPLRVVPDATTWGDAKDNPRGKLRGTQRDAMVEYMEWTWIEDWDNRAEGSVHPETLPLPPVSTKEIEEVEQKYREAVDNGLTAKRRLA